MSNYTYMSIVCELFYVANLLWSQSIDFNLDNIITDIYVTVPNNLQIFNKVMNMNQTIMRYHKGV